MASRVTTTTFHCTDAYRLSAWWKQVLGAVDPADDPNAPGDDECLIVDPITGHRLLFIATAELQGPAGRRHLDLAPTDRRRDEEVERILGLGARQVADRRRADGAGWVVLADPEGNEFCVVRSDAERETTGGAGSA